MVISLKETSDRIQISYPQLSPDVAPVYKGLVSPIFKKLISSCIVSWKLTTKGSTEPPRGLSGPSAPHLAEWIFIGSLPFSMRPRWETITPSGSGAL